MRTFPWPAYAAATWLVVFIGWHAPMLFGWNPLPENDPPANMVVFYAYDAVLIGIAAIGIAVVLATVRPWGRRIPRRLLLVPLVIGCVLLVLRGVPGFVEFVLQATGVSPTGLTGLFEDDPEPPTQRVLWAGYATNLFFFAGAVLLVPATLRFLRAREG